MLIIKYLSEDAIACKRSQFRGTVYQQEEEYEITERQLRNNVSMFPIILATVLAGPHIPRPLHGDVTYL